MNIACQGCGSPQAYSIAGACSNFPPVVDVLGQAEDSSCREMAFTEQDPLLPSIDNDRSQRSKPAPVGPLEISRSTRYAILAGSWSATFLAVRSSFVAFAEPSSD